MADFIFLTSHREWEGRKLDNSLLSEGLVLLANLKQSQVDAVLESIKKKRARMLVELTVDLMQDLLQV